MIVAAIELDADWAVVIAEPSALGSHALGALKGIYGGVHPPLIYAGRDADDSCGPRS